MAFSHGGMFQLYEISGKITRIFGSMGMIVIYTGDVEHADKDLKTRCLILSIEQVFVSHLPNEEIYQGIKHKLENKEILTEQELMRLALKRAEGIFKAGGGTSYLDLL